MVCGCLAAFLTLHVSLIFTLRAHTFFLGRKASGMNSGDFQPALTSRMQGGIRATHSGAKQLLKLWKAQTYNHRQQEPLCTTVARESQRKN